jgi:hypothetical protein
MTTKAVDVGISYVPATQHTTQGGYWTHLTASGVVLAVPGQIIGFYVNSTTAGTIQLFDNPAAAANPASGIITPALGMQWFPGIFLTGLFAQIVGPLDVTFFSVK